MFSFVRLGSLRRRLQPLVNNRLIDLIQKVFFVVAIIFVGLLAWASRDSIGLIVRGANWELLGLALIALMLHHLFAPAMVTRVLRRSEHQLSITVAFRIYGRRLPARYLPGGIWHAISTTLDYHSRGVPPRYLLAINLFQMAFINGFSFVLGGGGLALIRRGTIWEHLGFLGALAGLLMIVGAVAYVPKLVRVQFSRLYIIDVFWVSLYMLAMLTLFVFSLMFYLAAFPGIIRDVGLLELFSVLMFARGVGFIAFFSPKGIGIFEAVSAGLIEGGESFSPLVVVLAGFRLLGILTDALIWSVAISPLGSNPKSLRENK